MAAINQVGNSLTGLTGTGAFVGNNTPTLTSPVLNGTPTGTGVSTTSSASTLVLRDANQNAFANNFVSKATNVVSGAITTVLTAASARTQNLTGSSIQTFQLPDATTLSIGSTWYFNNNSTGNLSVVDNGSNPIATVLPGGQAMVTAIVVSTANGSWDSHFLVPTNASFGTAGLSIPGKLSANNSVNGFATTATAGATTTLTVSSAQNQEFTGTLTQTLILPVTSTLVAGQQYYIINNSSGAVTVQSSGANTIQVMGTSTSLLLTVVNTGVTTAAGWESAYIADTGASGIVNSGLINQLAYYAANGTTVSGLTTANRGFLVTSTTGVPSISNTITAVEDQSLNTTLGTPTLLLENSTGITYPSSAGFNITIGKYSNILANTSQTINSVTPGGINFLYGDRTLLTYSNNATNDLSAFYLTANNILARWSSTNTAQQLTGTTSTATYLGSDQGGRTTSSINGISGLVNINPPSSSNVTIANVSGISGGATCNHLTSTGAITTITNFSAITSNKTIASAAASNTITITNAASYNSIMTLSAAGAGSTLAITNMYGLRLQAPTIGANTTITNRYGISQEDASATNSFAGTITGALAITATAGIVTSGATGGGFSGQFRAYSTGVSLGSVSLTAANSAGNFANVLTNVSTTAARTWTLPDATGTVALTADITSTAVVLNPVADQTILAHDLTIAAGGLTTVGTIQNLVGNIIAGSSGNEGVFISYPLTNAKGALLIGATPNVDDYPNILTNAPTTAIRTWTLPNASGTIQLVGGALGAATATSLTFSPTTGGIVGTTTNDNVSAGTVGELDSTVVLLGSAVSLLTLTPIDVVTLVLQPGDYDVWGELWFDVNAATIVSSIQASINTTTATIATVPSENSSNASLPVTLAAGVAPIMTLGQCRISVATATTTTVYLVVNAAFSVNTLSGYGKILARRRR